MNNIRDYIVAWTAFCLAMVSTGAMVQVATTHAPAPITKSYGFAAGSSLPGLPEQELKNRLDGMKALGAQWVRFDVDWSEIQPDNKDSYKWEKYDRVVSESQKRGLNVLAIVDFTPKWARVSGCGSHKCRPQNYEDFAKFAGEAAARYASKGVKHWEIWNEPNNPDFWAPKPNPAEYSELLKAASRSIRAANPSAVIITAGLSPQATTDRSYAPVDFLSGVYDNNTMLYFDAVAHHPYTFPLSPTSHEKHAWWQMTDPSAGMRGVMVSHGDGDKKIWITEFGAPTGGPGAISTKDNPNLENRPYVVDEILQDQILRDAFAMYGSYDWAGPFFWYSYQDAGTAKTTNENFFGLVRHDGTVKPAAESFRRATTGQ